MNGTEPDGPALVLTNYSCGIEARAVFQPLDLQLERGEVLLVRGENGAGKSTLLRGIAGLCRTELGQITFDGIDLRAWSARRRIGAGMAYVPQSAGVFETLSVAENARLSALLLRSPGLGRAVDLDAAEFGIGPERRVGSLSGGERRVLACERALATDSRLLLLDEPLAGVASTLRDLIIHRVFMVVERSGCSVLWAEHDPQRLGARCARIVDVIPAI